MPSDIIYNQIICYNNSSITCQNIKKSFVERDKLILILDNSQKIIISGRNIETTEYKKRIHKLMLMIKDEGFEIEEKSVKHYAKDEKNEYVLVRW